MIITITLQSRHLTICYPIGHAAYMRRNFDDNNQKIAKLVINTTTYKINTPHVLIILRPSNNFHT